MTTVSCGMFLSGCDGAGGIMDGLKTALSFQKSKVWLSKVTLKASDDVNDSSLVTVDVVIVYKDGILTDLQKLNANDYFSKKAQFLKDSPDDVQIISFDVQKGERREEPIKLARMDALGGFVFARYVKPGIHRQALGQEREIEIQLNKADFKVIATDAVGSFMDFAKGFEKKEEKPKAQTPPPAK